MFKKHVIKNTKKLARAFGISILSNSRHDLLEDYWIENSSRELNFIKSMAPSHLSQILELLPSSKSQLRQDLFALSRLDFKENGFFVEFGATDGVTLSNSYLLERNFGWTGILAEPARIWQSELRRNRPRARIEDRCVWSKSGVTLNFNETIAAELSTVQDFSSQDGHRASRLKGNTYEVESVSLMDLLEEHSAPNHIDYLSVDTEGSEFAILKEFDFSKYSFGVITCEHNYTDNRVDIYRLLTANGYMRVHEEISEFDDWYVPSE
jgi:FkbM family methyltransferase